jgi:serine protease
MKEFHKRLPAAAFSTALFALASLPFAAMAQTAIDNGVPVTDLSAPTEGQLSFVIEVPEGSHELLVQTAGGTGDSDLFIRQGQMPTTDDYDCASFTFGNQDACLIEAPAAGEWFILLDAWEAFDGLLLLATYEDEPAQITPLEADVDLPVAGPAGSMSWFSVDVPENASEVVISIFPEDGSTGDGDLFVRFGERPLPTSLDWDCRPFEVGSEEECILTDPEAGTWYVGVHAWPLSGELTNVSILATGDIGEVVDPPAIPSNLSVTLSGARMRPDHNVTWNGGGAEVDVWLNGQIVFSGANTGSYTQRVPVFFGPSTWQVCNLGSTTECTD